MGKALVAAVILVVGACAVLFVQRVDGGGASVRRPAWIRFGASSQQSVPSAAEAMNLVSAGAQETPTPATPIESALGALHRASASRDGESAMQAAQVLQDWIAGDEVRALQVVQAFRQEPNPAILDLLASLLASDVRIAPAESVVREMLGAAQSDPSADCRRAALSFLSQSGARPAAVEGGVLSIVREDSDPVVRAAAIQAVRFLAGGDEAAAKRLNVEMLSQAARAEDAGTRVSALQAVQMETASEEDIRAIGEVLTRDASTPVRLSAVLRLAEAEPAQRPLALQLLTEGYKKDTELDVRRACVEALVRFGGATALASLQGFRESDAGLARDISDYVAILGSGESDWQRVCEKKARRDHASAR